MVIKIHIITIPSGIVGFLFHNNQSFSIMISTSYTQLDMFNFLMGLVRYDRENLTTG